MSNVASDVIAKRLVPLIGNGKDDVVYRFYAKSIEKDDIDPVLLPHCNINSEGNIYFPPLEDLYRKKVIVSTTMTAGNFARAKINQGIFSKNHFGYVFLDENASATEANSLIPIAGVCTENGSVTAKIVLAGDWKQLDPVVFSGYAKDMGLGMSLMERLSTYKRYSELDKRYVVRLKKNYRSHQAILQFPNELFYGNELEACASNVDQFSKKDNDIIRADNFPVIFYSVIGQHEALNDEDSSLFNMTEVRQVNIILNDLLTKYNVREEDIGVITPYLGQLRKLKGNSEVCAYKNIKFATVGEFQGQEKNVIIYSSVRSGEGRVGDFVTDPKRLNVAISRAKMLMIFVGNDRTLQQDGNWRAIIQKCKSHSTFVN